MSTSTKYRLYPDGEVVHQDEFDELDSAYTCYDDYKEVEIPDEIIAHIEYAVAGEK